MAAPTEYSFSTYTYSGPVQSVSLRGKSPQGKSVTYFEAVLHPGEDYLLPENHVAVLGWKAMKLIKPPVIPDDSAEPAVAPENATEQEA